MKAFFKLDNVGQQKATLTITMRLCDWQELADTIDDKWPGWKFRGAIKDMLFEANKHFMAEHEVDR